MRVRRILVWAVSAALGGLGTFGIIAGFGTTVQRFSVVLSGMSFIAIASFVFIWLDYFLKTEYLKR